MSTEQEFEKIFLKKKADDMLLFLKTLTEQERKALVPQIKSLAKEYLTYQTVGNSYKFKATDDQHRALAYASFICYNGKEFAKSFYAWIISREHLEKIFPWYVPSWFSNYINSFSSRDWLPYALDYL